ncbi:MAG: hypothetical protein GX539_15725 [Candidatus Cloacimonetes bacterium]|nr:hypothetical protein [Candidatus Cloacimonadota bacterium]
MRAMVQLVLEVKRPSREAPAISVEIQVVCERAHDQAEHIARTPTAHARRKRLVDERTDH